VAGTEARDFQMKVGRDTYVFDFNFHGQNISVYETREGEPYDDRMESIMHDWFALEDVIKGIPNALSGMTAKPPLAIGRTGDIGANAFAAIYDGRRYIVMSDQIHADYTMMALVMGHELGHHICGHTSETLQHDLWAQELEADSVSGMAIHSGSFGLNLQSALQYASRLFSPQGDPTHPPTAMRIDAIMRGYTNGSPCIGRPVGAIAANELGGRLRSADLLWSHNGSLMRLLANGTEREFLYEVPRTGLSAVGVSKGTLLFKGIKAGNSYSGTAYVFSQCGATPYNVSGPVSDDQRQVTLYGRAPIKDRQCSIASYRDDTLIFKFEGE
jgi:hypothetical protein